MKLLLCLALLFTACSANKFVPQKRVVERDPGSEAHAIPMAERMNKALLPEASFQGPFEINPPNFDRKAAKIYLPLQYDSQDKWPLIILLHGYGGNADFQDAYLTMHLRVSHKGFLLLTPEGTKDAQGKQFWNATDVCCDFGHTQVDDVDYLSKLISEVKLKYHVDSSRVYLFGHSNGGFMVNRLACEIGDQIAGIASLAGGSFKNINDCRQPKTMGFLQIHAENDSTVLYGNDPRYAGGVESVNQWVTRNDCPGAPQKAVHAVDFVSLIPGEDTSKKFWEKCKNNTQVSLWTIKTFEDSAHNPHIPQFNMNFSEAVIDYLFQFKRAAGR